MKVERKWGTYEVLYNDGKFQVKKLTVNPGGCITMQRHVFRNETWVWADGNTDVIPRGRWHTVTNSSALPIEIIEVQTGEYFGENDIERIN